MADAATENDDGGTVTMDETADTSAENLLALPEPCPMWIVKPPNESIVIGHSWANVPEATGTYCVPPQALLDLQSNKLLGIEKKENSICVASVLPCIVEQSPVIAACAGPRQPFSRYTTSMTVLSMLHDLRTLFGIVWYRRLPFFVC